MFLDYLISCIAKFMLKFILSLNKRTDQRIISKVLPVPFMDDTFSVPLCIMTICLERLSPIPEPSFLVVKNGMNIRSIISSGIPVPLSRMRMETLFPVDADTSRLTCGSSRPETASAAFLIRLMMTCSSRSISA